MIVHVPGPVEMEALGAALEAPAVRILAGSPARACVIGLEGPLGAGKTTLVRGLLRSLGVDGSVRSPTFTLLEPYRTPAAQCYHLDLYRISDPEELELAGLRDRFAEGALCMVEWPERGSGWLPDPDVRVRIEYAGEARRVEMIARSERARRVMADWRSPIGPEGPRPRSQGGDAS